VLLRALDAEGLAGEIEIPLARGSEEADDVEQVGMGADGVAVTDQVLGGGDPSAALRSIRNGPSKQRPFNVTKRWNRAIAFQNSAIKTCSVSPMN